MKLLDRYDFTNDRSFITYYLSPADTARMRVAECDVIGLRRRIIGTTESGETEGPMVVMRPDEALIMARMLIDAVNKVTSGYEIELKQQRPAIVIDGPPHFEDNETCGYCNRSPNMKHEIWCRQ